MLIGGRWIEPAERDAVRSPFDGRIVSYQPRSAASHLDAALDAAVDAGLIDVLCHEQIAGRRRQMKLEVVDLHHIRAAI